MAFNIMLPELCSDDVLQEGRVIRQSEGYAVLPAGLLPSGGILLQAKVTDSFNFVDHPWVELDIAEKAVSRFRCDCPAWRTSRRFCAHCAALVLELEEPQLVSMSASAEPDQTDVPPAGVLAEEGDAPDLRDLSYAFCNSAWDLYPRAKKPRIPLERYKQVFGDNARARFLYHMVGPWSGSCFGMVASASMLQQPESGICTADFSPDARIPSELALSDFSEALDMTLHTFIEAMHILQYSPVINSQVWENLLDPQCMENLAQRVAAFQRGEAAPVCMCIWEAPQKGGHAVLPYRLEKVSEREDVLHIYDPNWPMVTRYAYLNKDEEGRYLNWRFAMDNHMAYSSETGGQLSMDYYEIYKKEWDSRGGSGGGDLLSIQAGVAVMDRNGTVLARATEAGVESYRDDIFPILNRDGAADGAVMISLPAGSYTIRLEDSEQNELTVYLAGIDLSVEMTTTAREAVVGVEDGDMIAFAQITEPDARYTVEILNTAGLTSEEIQLIGITGQEGMCLLQKQGQLYGSGLANRTSLYINDAPVALERIGQLEEETSQEEPEMGLVTNAAAEEKPEEPQD